MEESHKQNSSSKLKIFDTMKFKVKNKNQTADEREENRRSKKTFFGFFRFRRQISPTCVELKATEDEKEIIKEESPKLSPAIKSTDISPAKTSSGNPTKESWLNVESKICNSFTHAELVYVKENGTKVPVVLKGLVSERRNVFERKIKDLEGSRPDPVKRYLKPKVLNFEPKFDPKREKVADYKLGIHSWNPNVDLETVRTVGMVKQKLQEKHELAEHYFILEVHVIERNQCEVKER